MRKVVPAKVKRVSLIPIRGIPLIQPGDDLLKIVLKQIDRSGKELRSGDVLVITQKVVSKAEGAMVDLKTCRPSPKAIRLARSCKKDPRVVELVLRESKKVLRVGDSFIVTEHKKGWVCANAGVDYSNVPGEYVTLLPEDSDRTAERFRQRVKEVLGVDVAILIIDSHGRPFRKGAVGVAIGSCGLSVLVDKRGEEDLFHYRLKGTEMAQADELASAASMIMGQTNEGIPAVIIRGMEFSRKGSKARDLIRPEEQDLFR